MARADADSDTDGSIRAEIQRVLSAHPVSFAMLFGSAARESIATADDIDLAVEFGTHRPTDDGYSDVYLKLVGDLESALSTDVDIVDVHTMDESFATVVFDEGEVLVGNDRRSELTANVTGERPSAERARDRVAAAADRLTEPDG
ncbi:nucleotidyltransferase domain-containing protein [Halonotius sp. F2-221B]|uniref:type VII toxin-antitoxin system MntA family adenylyltransferase antitoxin n=1 Tax=Halonotius sp. F2-221B TaxID=2731620 RepID=UPI00398A7705